MRLSEARALSDAKRWPSASAAIRGAAWRSLSSDCETAHVVERTER